MRAIGVDFDGVIHKYSKGWGDGTIYDDPMPGALEGIKELQKEYAVFVFTTREVTSVALWLCNQGVAAIADVDLNVERSFWNNQEVVLVTNRKLAAVAYLDDRAVRFKDWQLVYYQLKKYGV